MKLIKNKNIDQMMSFKAKLLVFILLAGLIIISICIVLTLNQKPQFTITQEDCWNVGEDLILNVVATSTDDVIFTYYSKASYNLSGLEGAMGIEGISLPTPNPSENISFNFPKEVYKVDCPPIVEFGYCYFINKTTCEQKEVDSIELKDTEYGIKEIGRNISILNLSYPMVVRTAENRQYIEVIKELRDIEYGYCINIEDDNVEVVVPSGFPEMDCRIEEWEILDYDEIVNTETISKQDLTIGWLDKHCDDYHIVESNKKRTQWIKTRFSCGDYTVEVVVE